MSLHCGCPVWAISNGFAQQSSVSNTWLVRGTRFDFSRALAIRALFRRRHGAPTPWMGMSIFNEMASLSPGFPTRIIHCSLPLPYRPSPRSFEKRFSFRKDRIEASKQTVRFLTRDELIRQVESPDTEKKSLLKLLVSFVYCLTSLLITAFVMVIVHDRVPG